MSQTQEFNRNIIEKVFSQLENINFRISTILDKDTSIGGEQETLTKLLIEKEQVLNYYVQILESPQMRTLFNSNPDFWRNRINQILSVDESNLDKMKTKFDALTEKMKNFNKQKSLMIYLKGEQ